MCGHSLDPVVDKTAKNTWEKRCMHCVQDTIRPSPCQCYDCTKSGSSKRKSLVATPDQPPPAELLDQGATTKKMSSLRSVRSGLRASRQDLVQTFRSTSVADLGAMAAQSLRRSKSGKVSKAALDISSPPGSSRDNASSLKDSGKPPPTTTSQRTVKPKTVSFGPPKKISLSLPMSESDSESSIDPGPGPTIRTGRWASEQNPIIARKLLKKMRRSRSDRNPDAMFLSGATLPVLPDVTFTTLQDFRAAVLHALTLRLNNNQISTAGFTTKAYAWCFPKSLQHVNQWRLLFEEPIATDDVMLNQIFDLEQVTADTPAPPPNSKMFYVRSFQLSVLQLREVITCMLFDGYDMNPWIFAWLEKLTGLSDVTHVLTQATVHTFTLANAMGMAVDDDLMNFYEQLLVALFGDCLLNTELGGKDVIFITEEDQEAFGQLRSHTIESFNTTKPCSAHMMQAIETYAQNVRAYVDSHPTTRKGRRSARRFNDETEAMLIRQGTPRTLSIDGSAVTVTLGSDLGEDHEQDEGTFWEAGGRSADVVTNIYSRFLEWEAGPTASYNPIGFKSLCENHLWPMADVFAWYVKHKEDYSKAGEFLASYINAVRPWIIICYGSLPTFAAQRNFESFTQNQYDNKISNDNYHWRQNNSSWAQDVLAVPQVLSFNAGQGPTTDKEFLLIPCYHPGFTGHSGVLKEKLTRLLVLTHALAWAATHHAIVIDRENPTRARRDKINMLHSMLLTKISTTHPFGRALADAKAAYKDVTKAHNECSLQRAGNTALRKPRTGLLPGKTVKKPAKSPVRSGETVAEIGEGFKVTLEETGWIPGATGIDAKRHRLNWTESDGQERTLHHIMLPAGVAPTDPNTPRFLY
ncbi:hypothetical protein N0V86_001965 [Didymella sp. IMI 355093]|nr:hypothetical protein N0V86_001965 [Didymella sp. IMI 355093]